MSEMEAGAPMFRAMVETYPRIIKTQDEPISVRIHVRYRRKKTIFAIDVGSTDEDFDKLTTLRPGDEMYVSPDGEDISDITRNPLIKRLWLRLIWSF